MKLKPAIVYWEDAQTLRKEDLPEKCPIMQSIGFVERLKDYVLVITLLTPEQDLGNGCCTITPNGCVKKIRWLSGI